MTSPHARQRSRAGCAALRNLRSAALAVAVVTLPDMTHFVQRGDFTRRAALDLLRALLVALLMLLFNHLQRLSQRDTSGAARFRALFHRGRRNGHG